MYLPKVIKFNSKDPAALKRYGVIADYMHLGGKNDEEKVDLLIAYLRKMNDDLNIPHSINHYGPKGLPEEKGRTEGPAGRKRLCAGRSVPGESGTHRCRRHPGRLHRFQSAPAQPGRNGEAAEVLLLRYGS